MKMLFRISLLVALFTASAIAHAKALSFKDISGKWCSGAGDYNFRRDMLIATFHDRTPTRVRKSTGNRTASVDWGRSDERWVWAGDESPGSEDARDHVLGCSCDDDPTRGINGPPAAERNR